MTIPDVLIVRLIAVQKLCNLKMVLAIQEETN